MKQAELYEGNGRVIFSDEDISALLTRDESVVTAQFAETTAIVIGDRAFSPYWIYSRSFDDYRKEGITPQMIQKNPTSLIIPLSRRIITTVPQPKIHSSSSERKG